MKQPRTLGLVLAFLVSFAGSDCGALIGNPGKPTGAQSTAFIRTIDYEIPTSVSGYELQEPKDDLFRDSMNRLDLAIERVNQLVTRLNGEGIGAAGTFTGKGPDADVRVSVTVIDGNGYDLRAVICQNETPFQLLEWSSKTGNVHSIRSHAVDPLDPKRRRNMISDITYEAGEAPKVRAAVYLTQGQPLAEPPPDGALPPSGVAPPPPGGGPPPPGGATASGSSAEPPPGMDGSDLAELIVSSRTDGIYAMSGIHNWVDDPTTVTEEGDEYFIGTFSESGTGETVGYNVARSECEPTFDEATPNWCTGKDLSGTVYDAAAIAAAAQRMQAIAVVGRGSLVKPELPSGLTCP